MLATVDEVMVKQVNTIDEDVNVVEAAKRMEKSKCGCLLVTKGGIGLGIVTERDLVRKVLAIGVDASKVLIKDVMSTPLITIPPSSTLEDAARLMSQYGIRRLPVAKDRVINGLITASDIALYLANNSPQDPLLGAIARKPHKQLGPYA